MSGKKATRRQFLQGLAAATGGTLLAACQPQTVIVKETVPVKETVIVEQEKEVTKEVVKEVEVTSVVTKEVTKVVEKEKVITATPGPGPCQMDWTPTYPEPFKVYDPAVVIKLAGMGYDESAFPAPNDYHIYNHPLYNRAVKYTSIRYETTWETTGDPASDNQKLMTDIAAGTPPDQWDASGVFLQQLIDQGAVAEFKDVWDETASDLVKELKEYPDHYAWRDVLQGNALYGICRQSGPADNDDIGFIRQDWLDKANLDMPETIEEITETARKWKAEGICDYGIAASMDLVSWMVDLAPVLGAFGAMQKCWVPDGEGGLKYDSISPGMKEALAQIASWYGEGLMDPDFNTYAPYPGGYQSISSEKCGMWWSPYWNYNIDLNVAEQIPDFLQVIMPYPKGPRGEQGRYATLRWGSPVVYKAGIDPIKIEASINNLNWHTELHHNWTKYQQYGELNTQGFDGGMFLEGLEWNFDENCELVKGDYTGYYHLMETVDWQRPAYPAQVYDTFKEAALWIAEEDKSTLNKAERFIAVEPYTQRNVEGYNFSYETQDVQITDRFFGTPTERMTQLLPDLQTLESTVFLNIIVGNEPIERFDHFVEEWKAMGGDQVTEDVNAWWATI